MFVGHFGVSLAVKKIAPQINLGVLFAAGQALDLIWPVLVLSGIEQVSVEPDATVVTPLNFQHYPYSHSLLMTLIYSLLGAFIAWKFYKGVRAAVVIGGTILSHWVLDLVTHKPDLPLAFGDMKLGMGLWNSVWGTFVIEFGIFVLGIYLYLTKSPLVNRKQKLTFWSMILFLSLIYFGNLFGPKAPIETPPAAIAGPALAMWLIVLWAYFADRSEKYKTAPKSKEHQ